MLALTKKPGARLHLVNNSELIFMELKGKCAKWQQQGWSGSRGPLAHLDLWEGLWSRLLL